MSLEKVSFGDGGEGHFIGAEDGKDTKTNSTGKWYLHLFKFTAVP